MITAEMRADTNSLIVREIEELEQLCHRRGLHVTARALNRAKNALGWELAGNVEEAGRAGRDERPR